MEFRRLLVDVPLNCSVKWDRTKLRQLQSAIYLHVSFKENLLPIEFRKRQADVLTEVDYDAIIFYRISAVLQKSCTGVIPYVLA